MVSRWRYFPAWMLSVVAVIGLHGVLLAQGYKEELFKGMQYRLIGPFRGGRVIAVTGVPDDPLTYYFGAVSGGVWKTVDGGLNWTPSFEKEHVSSIGSIAVAASDPNVVYVGTGEACIRGNISYGDGVYKSLDGGKTWKNVGLRDSRQIGRVIVHPRNPDIVFVAALGHAFGPNKERGIFRTLDGGKTWEQVLFRDERTGGIDVTFDPSNPNILFAALWEAARSPWSLSSGGPGSGLYKSIDGGATWKRLEGNGLPKGILGRIGVSVSGADSNRVYALIEAEEGGLYRSDDGGEKWTRVNDDHRFRQRAWYFTHIFADPKSVDTLVVLNTGFFRSTDGGHRFAAVPAPHGDHHALWIDPKNPLRMINGNDGGATITTDGGKTWSSQDNQPTAQFYHVVTDTRFPYYVYGAQQDNSTVGIASRGDRGAIGPWDWYPVGGGESGYIAPYPPDPGIVYAGSYAGTITRFDRRTWQSQNVAVWPEDPIGYGAAGLTHRFQWTSPLVISPHDPNVLYAAGESLFKSTDGGMSWTPISPDLTRNDKSKQESSGGPITKDNTSIEYYDTIFAVAESSVQRDLIWGGTDDGLIQLTRDGGQHWEKVTPKEMPEWSLVSLIDASPHDAGTAYVAVDRHKLDDLKPYIYKTADYGKTWVKITNGLPEGSFVHAVREDPKRRGLLYAGTETGVFVSFDDGAHWEPLQLNLPTTPIHDLAVKDDDLVVATHGRSFWILDDISPLRQLNEAVSSADVYLFQPCLAYRTRGGGFLRPRGPLGQNPPAGAILYYSLKTVPKEKEEIKLEIYDSQGKLVRKYSNLRRERPEGEPPPEFPELGGAQAPLPAEAGLNRFNWDLRYEGPARVPGAVAFGAGGALRGPFALPGTYQVKLTAAGKTLAVPLELRLDPRVKTSEADIARQFDLAMQIHQRVNQANEAINRMRDLRNQIKELRGRLGHDGNAGGVLRAAEELDKRMTPVEEELIQVKSKASEDDLNYPVKLSEQLLSLGGVVESADAAPTSQAYQVFEKLARTEDEQLAKWQGLVSKDLVALNDLMRKENIPMLMVSRASE